MVRTEYTISFDSEELLAMISRWLTEHYGVEPKVIELINIDQDYKLLATFNYKDGELIP